MSRPSRDLRWPLALAAAILTALACRVTAGRPVGRAGAQAEATPAPVPAPGPRFFALGDGGTGSPDQHRVGSAVREKCASAGCDFGVLLGDNFYPDGVESAEDPQWATKFEQPYAGILAAGIPFYAVLGNHDYADGRDFGRGAHQVAYGQNHPLWRMPAAHYAFAEGHAAFLALDTTALDARLPGAEAEQARTVEQALAANSRPWVIALGHHPLLSNGTNGNARGALERFLSSQVCPRADLYISGHDHNLQVLAHASCRALLAVSGGGGYATYTLPGGHATLFQTQALGFMYVSVEPARLTVEVVGADGQTLFSHALTR
jgi:hypothetical protein